MDMTNCLLLVLGLLAGAYLGIGVRPRVYRLTIIESSAGGAVQISVEAPTAQSAAEAMASCRVFAQKRLESL